MPNALEVDVTGWTIARLTAALAAGVASDTPADLAARVPFVRVIRAGGGDDGVVLDAATMVLHCFAADEQGANQLAHQARTALRALLGVVADGAVLTKAVKIGGPTWTPYENSSVRHAVLTMRLFIKTA